MTTMAALDGNFADRDQTGRGRLVAPSGFGVAVVAGLLFSQFLTLYITPVFYTLHGSVCLRSTMRGVRGRQIAPSLEPQTAAAQIANPSRDQAPGFETEESSRVQARIRAQWI